LAIKKKDTLLLRRGEREQISGTKKLKEVLPRMGKKKKKHFCLTAGGRREKMKEERPLRRKKRPFYFVLEGENERGGEFPVTLRGKKENAFPQWKGIEEEGAPFN